MFVWKSFRNVFSGRDKLRRTLRNFLHTNYISIYSLLAGINPLAWDRTNHRLRSWANGVSQTNNDCRQAYFSFPPPLPRYFSFQPNSHSLGRIFVSLQASSKFESKMALAWSNSQPRSPKYACIAGYIKTGFMCSKELGDLPVEDSVETSNNSSQVVWQQLQCFYNDWTESHHMSKINCVALLL